jgi:hypothetical protein
MNAMNKELSAYFSALGRKGGAKSRRVLSSDEARQMVRIREARRIFKRFYAQCFWYMRPDLNITRENIPVLVRGLRQNGGRQGFLLAAKLCQ